MRVQAGPWRRALGVAGNRMALNQPAMVLVSCEPASVSVRRAFGFKSRTVSGSLYAVSSEIGRGEETDLRVAKNPAVVRKGSYIAKQKK